MHDFLPAWINQGIRAYPAFRIVELAALTNVEDVRPAVEVSLFRRRLTANVVIGVFGRGKIIPRLPRTFCVRQTFFCARQSPWRRPSAFMTGIEAEGWPVRLWSSFPNSRNRFYGRGTHIPLQSRPSLVGSQLSEGSSMHTMPPIHSILDGPPHGCLILLCSPPPATHFPGQLRPSLVGSHLSAGSSTHDMPRGQLMALGPPQGNCLILPSADFAEGFGVPGSDIPS